MDVRRTPREQGTERDRSSRDPIADPEEEALGPAGVPWKTAARIATVGIFFLMFCVILALAQTILLPVVSAFVIGTMLGPLTRLGDRLRMPQWLSATLVMAAFVGFLALSVTLLSAPIVEWIERAPDIGNTIREKLRVFDRPLAALSDVRAAITPADSSPAWVTRGAGQPAP